MAKKIDFYKIFELTPKTVYKGVLRYILHFSGRKKQKKPKSRGNDRSLTQEKKFAPPKKICGEIFFFFVSNFFFFFF